MLLRWLSKLLAPRTRMTPELSRAEALLAAIDAGGVPLHPLRINQIARDLGLEVSRHAKAEETIARIRAALNRA